MFKFLFECLHGKFSIFNKKISITSLFLIMGMIIAIISIFLFKNKWGSVIILPFFYIKRRLNR